jgi:hypothetical protein
MLHKSGHNLEKGAIDFISNNESITIFSAYIKLNELKRINIHNNIKQIVVRWEIEDLCRKVSDIELYDYCIDNNIRLYRNTRLHMKALWNNQDALLFGSANVTGRGLGERNLYNYELNGIADELSQYDIDYLHHVVACSQYVSKELFEKINDIVENIVMPILVFPELPTTKSSIDYFLISQLPMSLSPDDFYEVATKSKDFEYLERNCAAHDKALFEIDPFQDYTKFKIELKSKFNAHPFIIALKEHIKSLDTKSLRYGGVVNWIKDNTTTVPTPRSWKIKEEQIVNILYSWICEFDPEFTWSIPGVRSQVIFYYGK